MVASSDIAALVQKLMCPRVQREDRRMRPALVLSAALLLPACATTMMQSTVAPPPAPAPSVMGEDAPAIEEGLASFYSDSLAGNATANGEDYDPAVLTAAHRTLRFGTRVEVIRENGARVTVCINDRGPFVRGRVIDVSRAAAVRLDMLRAGVVPVRVETLD
jgi:rare lipoprotein A